MKFKKVDPKFDFVKNEQEVLKFWKENDIFKKQLEKNKNGKTFSFYDGPPTANGKPHIGHFLTRTVKDIFPRFKAMKGFNVPRQAGWDTHGLPVELEVEKSLGIDGKKEIENYGIEPFIQKCRESVWKYKKHWEEMSERMGYWVDMEKPYITYENNYIESIWWALTEMFKKKLIYRGHKIVPFCPRCGTALSSHEVAQNYKDVKEISIFVKFPVTGEKETYFLAWTTTPWTLPSNVALCVNPDEKYVLIEIQNTKYKIQNNENDKCKCDSPHSSTESACECGDCCCEKSDGKTDRFYLAESLVSKLFEGKNYKIIKNFKGRELERKKYEPLFKFADFAEEAHYITCDKYVTLTDGSGIVHIAPAFGEDDSAVGKKYNLPMLQLVGPDGKFVKGTGELEGIFIKAADPLVIKNLKERNLLFRELNYAHSYPHCWRCETPLIYYARSSWFIKTTSVKDKLVANNRTVTWIPENIKEGRMGNFLENNIDWGISRERYWGTPLPFFVCGDCGEIISIGSIKELMEKCGLKEEVELHKPYVDNISCKCPKCSGKMKRTPEVMDCWFDSGSMPFASYHYPFENKELFKKTFPADFIAEGQDQTRGWFYSLQAVNTILFGVSPYKACIVNGMVNDKNGIKMSKRLGNVTDPWEVMNKEGADALRWYFYVGNAPHLGTNFNEEALLEFQRKFMGTLWNVYSFFILYADIDGFNPSGNTKYKIQNTPENTKYKIQNTSGNTKYKIQNTNDGIDSIASLQNDKKDSIKKFPSKIERCQVQPDRECDLPLMDKWIISKLNSLIKFVNSELESLVFTDAARAISEFVDDLSNWYVRRSRERFWVGGIPDDKIAAFETLYYVLENLTKLIAPFVPFLSESIYQNLVRSHDCNAPSSVHLCTYPLADEKLIDKSLESGMSEVLNIAFLGRSCRAKSNIKNRQPLDKMIVGSLKKFHITDELLSIVKDELNVENIEFKSDASEYISYSIKPQLKTLGPKYGKHLNFIRAWMEKCDGNEVVKKLSEDENIIFSIGGGEKIILTKEDVLVLANNKEGYVAETTGEITVVLDVNLTDELIQKGNIREIISKIQSLRKEKDFEIADHITIDFYSDDSQLLKNIEQHKNLIHSGTLSDEIYISKNKDGFDKIDVNGTDLFVRLSVVK